MKDCDCSKSYFDNDWPQKNDYGDKMLREESTNMIDIIKKDFKKNIFNVNSVFNRKFEREEINMEIGEVDIDYTYLEPEMKEEPETKNIFLFEN